MYSCIHESFCWAPKATLEFSPVCMRVCLLFVYTPSGKIGVNPGLNR